MSDADIAAEATATLRRMFGAQADVPDALGCAHSQWGSDPMARGSWSYFPFRDTSNGYAGDTSVLATGCAVLSGGGVEGGAENVPEEQFSPISSTTQSTTASAAELTPLSVPLGALLQSTRPARSPLRSVTISEAAATVYPLSSPYSTHTANPAFTAVAGTPGRPSNRHYYSSDATGYTSEGTVDSESTDSDDSDSEDSDAVPAGMSMYSRHTLQQDQQKGLLSASSSDEFARRSVDDIVSAHVCYASEAMSVLNRGTVHGAYMSGIREATKILSFLDSAR